MQAAAASSPKDVEGDESLRSFVDDLDHVLGAQWPSASPAARAEDWLPTLTRAVSVNRTVRSLKEEKEAVVPPVPPVVLFSARQPLGYHGRLLPLQHSSRAAHLDAFEPSPAGLVESSGTEGAIDARHQLQPPIAADDRHDSVLANDEPYSRQNLALFQVFCERVLSLSPLIQLASPHPDRQCPSHSTPALSRHAAHILHPQWTPCFATSRRPLPTRPRHTYFLQVSIASLTASLSGQMRQSLSPARLQSHTRHRQAALSQASAPLTMCQQRCPPSAHRCPTSSVPSQPQAFQG
jgi:hypothetical protein